MPVLLLLLFFAVTFFALRRRASFCFMDIPVRGNVLAASVIFGAWGALGAEALGIFSLLGAAGIAWVWTAGIVIGGLFGLTSGSTPSKQIFLPSLAPPERVFIGGVVLIMGATAFIAVLAPPNTWDSLTYHMARVVHWIQNESLRHYPTHIERQLFMNPFAEIAIAHLMLLTGGDRLVNLVQWFSALGSLVAVSVLAKDLGAGRRGQLISVLIAATLPMAIVQSSGTQTDLVVTFWLCCFAVFVFRLADSAAGFSASIVHAVFAGASLGLAILTKPTAYIFGFPFGLWFLFVTAKRFRMRVPRLWLLAGLAGLLLNAGHFGRNAALYGSPLGPSKEASAVMSESANREMSPRLFLSNVIRNAAMHLGTPSGRINRVMERSVDWIHEAIGIDAADERATVYEHTFKINKPSTAEGLAGNPIHLAALWLAILLVLFQRRTRTPRAVAYAGALVGGYMLYCALIAWGPFRSRYHVTLFVLGAPLTGYVISRQAKQGFVYAAALIFFLPSLWWVGWNRMRPLTGGRAVWHAAREEGYFNALPRLADVYDALSAYLTAHPYRRIGLLLHENDEEYLIWNAAPDGTRIEHVHVTENESRKLPVALFEPDALILSRRWIAQHPDQFQEMREKAVRTFETTAFQARPDGPHKGLVVLEQSPATAMPPPEFAVGSLNERHNR